MSCRLMKAKRIRPEGITEFVNKGKKIIISPQVVMIAHVMQSNDSKKKIRPERVIDFVNNENG